MTEDVLALIDSALADWTVGPDAMRSAPEPVPSDRWASAYRPADDPLIRYADTAWAYYAARVRYGAGVGAHVLRDVNPA